MTKLNDIQLILLTTAAQRDNGSLLPAAASVADDGDRLTKAISALAKRDLVEEGPATDAASTHRTDVDDRFGMFITDAGRATINVEPANGKAADEGAARTRTPVAPKPERQTKSAAVVALLQRDDGATLAELIEATGWLPHTTRAALTGLRKKGHVIDKSKRGDATCYRIVAAA
ncbi:MAG: hypothetical protein QOD42_1115 [Sphingomonadales bacterium]|jgi:hypothetical protein|nr:hypothetical protein [Sphingomonadales bacterium]